MTPELPLGAGRRLCFVNTCACAGISQLRHPLSVPDRNSTLADRVERGRCGTKPRLGRSCLLSLVPRPRSHARLRRNNVVNTPVTSRAARAPPAGSTERTSSGRLRPDTTITSDASIKYATIFGVHNSHSIRDADAPPGIDPSTLVSDLATISAAGERVVTYGTRATGLAWVARGVGARGGAAKPHYRGAAANYITGIARNLPRRSSFRPASARPADVSRPADEHAVRGARRTDGRRRTPLGADGASRPKSPHMHRTTGRVSYRIRSTTLLFVMA
ncbi:hypothetical protein EVAR_102545_1 [Eumeta japonica]|uniref:Uncharacterized protein n=1 Tax=Eumeta variegata TaxID=151549 RepID=A0A4C2A8K3_EUMVA|nr:hypothetical protein EVAR_102545_1 [Eumeta japonica]